MNNDHLLGLLGLTLLLTTLAGCSGGETFSKLARAGDAVAVAISSTATVHGPGLCVTCSGDTEVWGLSRTNWIQVTPTSTTSIAIRFTVPGGAASSPGVVWVGNADAETDFAVRFQ